MEAPAGPVRTDQLNSPSALIGKTVEGNIVIDQGQWLDEAQATIAAENPSSDQQKITFAERYVKSKLKDAIFAKSNSQTYSQHQTAIDRVLTSEEPRRISEVLAGGYGVCPDFQAVELALLDQMRMEAYLAGNPSKQHLFLFVKQDGKWVVSDPFAENYFETRGVNSTRFSPDYYQGPDIKLFDKTSNVNQPPEISPLPAPASKPKIPTMTLADLKARAASQKSVK